MLRARVPQLFLPPSTIPVLTEQNSKPWRMLLVSSRSSSVCARGEQASVSVYAAYTLVSFLPSCGLSSVSYNPQRRPHHNSRLQVVKNGPAVCWVLLNILLRQRVSIAAVSLSRRRCYVKQSLLNESSLCSNTKSTTPDRRR